MQPADPMTVGVLGRRIVADLTDTWGVEGLPGSGKAVWARIATRGEPRRIATT
jgi:hypothetical protein